MTADTPVLPPTRQAGVCLHLTSLPGAHGIGEIGSEARNFVDALAQMKLRVWQFLPTGPTAAGNSPYQPSSGFAGNEMLLDVDALRRDGLVSARECGVLEDLPRNAVDYERLAPAKRSLLARAAARFKRDARGALRTARDDFVYQRNSRWLHDYALFLVLKEQHGGRPWPQWDTPFVHRDAQALSKVAAARAGELEAVKTLQFLFWRQWRELRGYAADAGVRLFGDLPIYAPLDSAEVWSRRALFRLDRDGNPDRVAGVPPDYFSEDGQLWGNPLYDWPHHAATGYQWWIERLRHAFGEADLVRLDHFRGFESFWSVPADATTARDGYWEPGPGAALFDAARAALGELPIVAENLGVITPEVEALRSRCRMPGMRVLHFDVLDEHFDLESIEEDCVCYTGTHDNDTTVGWFAGGQHARRADDVSRTRRRALEATGGSPGTIHDDLVRLAYASPAKLAIAPMQDYLGLGSEARLNTPGTVENNWRWRLAEQPDAAVCDHVLAMVEAAGRGN